MDTADQFCPGCGKTRQTISDEPIALMQAWESTATAVPERHPESVAPAATLPEAVSPTAVAAAPAVTRASAAPNAFYAPVVSPQTRALPAVVSGKATASLVCGILSIFGLTALAAIVLGHLALAEMKRSAGRVTGQGRAIAGLVLGYLFVLPTMLMLLAIAIPNIMRLTSKGTAGDEAAVVSSLRSINAAEASYSDKYPLSGYSCDFQKLRAVGTIDEALASGKKSGYNFELSSCLASSSGMVQLYQATAVPSEPGKTGTSAYCTDQTGVIRYDKNGSAVDCLASGTPVN